MNASENAINLIKQFESLRLTAYPDPLSVDGRPWTIGWGSTNGSIPHGESFVLGQTIDEATAERWLRYEISAHIEPAINSLVDFDLSQNEFDALTSFCFNLGTGCLQHSTMLKRMNSDDFAGAQTEFLLFSNANGQPERGLLRRRLTESVLFGNLTREELITQYIDGYDPDIA
jgi:GH24 family phage-related lysozyme (muramidase)